MAAMRPFSRNHPPTAIVAIGRNYAAHAAEMKGAAPERPVVFMKNPASVIGNGEPIVIPPICAEHGPQVDYEGELAVLVGREIRDASPDAALGAVSHYLIANDVSARWWQREGSGGQFVRGKSFDTFCPLSAPVPAQHIGDPQSLVLSTRLPK
jgi:2-keto-4-pentenoate hydratase/2-oxohepta-3-ene-1,7-dioic acid hydratase in catechol pathway